MHSGSALSRVLAPWLEQQLHALLDRQAHALLLEGSSGLGQFELAFSLACAWLCEQPRRAGACGQCASCHLLAARTHPDLVVLMPEVQMISAGWPVDEKAQAEIDDKKRKPSKEIRVDAMRAAVEFAHTTHARGRGKVVLVYPAESMNTISANTLLKTLEEPSGQLRFILASEAAHLLLPTIRSRCQSHAMRWPSVEQAHQWLSEQHEQAQSLWAASGQRPGLAEQMAASGMTVAKWAAFPQAAARGQVAAFDGLSAPQLVEVLQKICHDLWLIYYQAPPRFFSVTDLPPAPSLRPLQAWTVALTQHAKVAEHPFQAALYVQSLISQAQSAINSRLNNFS